MNSESDGEKKEPQRSRLFRHNSVGTIPDQEINEFIGDIVNKKSEEFKTYISRYARKKSSVNKTQQKKGNSNIDEIANGNKDKDEVHVQGLPETCDIEILNEKEKNIIFKPGLSIQRTPPPSGSVGDSHKQDEVNKDLVFPEVIENQNSNSNSNVETEQNVSDRKRYRSSPEPQRNNKKKNLEVSRDELTDDNTMNKIRTEENKFISVTNNIQETEESETEYLDAILKALETIDTATNKEINDTILFTRIEQGLVRKSVLSLHKMLTKIVYRIGLLDKENAILKSQQPQIKQKDTYATKTANSEVTPQRQTITEQKKPWTTPPTNNKIETIVRLPNDTDAEKTMKAIKENLKKKDTDGVFKNIRPTKNGAVIIESHSQCQQEKLRKAMENQSEITLKELNKTDPMVMITGVEKGYDESEFVTELIRQNPDINNLEREAATKIKVVVIKPCRNELKENWVLKSTPTIVKWLLRKEKINFDLTATYVQEYLPVTMCYKCLGFGHVTKYCNKEDCCHKCGGKHRAETCSQKVLNCPNCSLMGYAERNHSARDRNCPTYQRKLDRSRRNVNYDNKQSFLG